METYWNCKICTFNNPRKNAKCFACGNPAEFSPEDIQDTGWICSFCTLKNSMKSKKCLACGGQQHSAVEDDNTAYKLDHTSTKEIRLVLLGRTGSGKSATGNTILDGDYFDSKTSGSSVTHLCSSMKAKRFGRTIQVVDTPGIFDTSAPNEVIQSEIFNSIRLTSPGPDCFLLVLGVSRFTEEEEATVDHFLTYFGDDILKHLIIVFTRKDDLDHHKLTVKDHIKSAPSALKNVLERCENRFVAFDNRTSTSNRDEQVRSLLDMVESIIRVNNGKCYTSKMYHKAEQIIKRKEKDSEKQEELQKEREREQIEREIKSKYRHSKSHHHRKSNRGARRGRDV